MNGPGYAAFNLLMLLLVAYIISLGLKKRQPHRTEQGSAFFLTEYLLLKLHLLTGRGLIVGRSDAGSLITIPNYTHTLVIGGTGSGKGVGFVIPNLLTYRAGSVVVFDVKDDLLAATASRRYRMGDRIIDLRSDGTRHCLNPLDLIPPDSPTLIDDAAMLAAGMIVMDPGEKEPYWNERARVILTALLVYALKALPPNARNLASVQNIATVPKRMAAAAAKLDEMGGIYQRFAGQINSLFESGFVYTKEGSGAMAVLTRHTAFLDSESVTECVSTTTFDPRWLLRPGCSLYMHIPPHRLESQKGLLRLWVSTLVWVIGSQGSEVKSETLFMLDECSALGSLNAVGEALVRGRSAGVRMCLIYQSEDQIRSAFPQLPTIIPDNCATQVFIGAPTSIESAKRRSEMVGDMTLEVESETTSYSGASGTTSPGVQHTHGRNTSRSLMKRALVDPAEMLKLGNHAVLVYQRGLPALVLAHRIEYYRDPAFSGNAAKQRKTFAPWRWRLPSLRRLPLLLRVVIGVGLWLGLMFWLRSHEEALRKARQNQIINKGAGNGPVGKQPAKDGGGKAAKQVGPGPVGGQGKVGRPPDR